MPRRLNTPTDIWRRIAVGAPSECWPFIGSVSTSGYGQFYFDGHQHTAHRVAYELTKGPIPDGLQLDHLCRNRRCCNPDHLDPVTALENINRSPISNGNKTHCPQGHPYSGDNVLINKASGGRMCRVCNYADARNRKRRKRAANVAAGLTTNGTPRKRTTNTQPL